MGNASTIGQMPPPFKQNPKQPSVRFILDPETKNPMGRPRTYKTSQEFIERASDFFRACTDDKGKVKVPITITGLANYCGTTRFGLIKWEQERDEAFSAAVKHAKSICEMFAEGHGYIAKNPAFSIFALKQHGWKDIITTETTVDHVVHMDESTAKLAAGLISGLLQGLQGSTNVEMIDITPRQIVQETAEKVGVAVRQDKGGRPKTSDEDKRRVSRERRAKRKAAGLPV